MRQPLSARRTDVDRSATRDAELRQAFLSGKDSAGSADIADTESPARRCHRDGRRRLLQRGHDPQRGGWPIAVQPSGFDAGLAGRDGMVVVHDGAVIGGRRTAVDTRVVGGGHRCRCGRRRVRRGAVKPQQPTSEDCGQQTQRGYERDDRSRPPQRVGVARCHSVSTLAAQSGPPQRPATYMAISYQVLVTMSDRSVRPRLRCARSAPSTSPRCVRNAKLPARQPRSGQTARR